jgi:hypothetical protein
MASFTTVVANDLEEIQMIAGDEKILTYTVYDSETGTAVDITGATCSVSIFRYGDPAILLLSLPGVVTGSDVPGEFKAEFPSSSSISLSGVYQQQPKIVDYLNKTHIPSQGKIVIFPTPSS